TTGIKIPRVASLCWEPSHARFPLTARSYDSGLTGSLNATPVPFESSPVAPLTVLPILGLMGFYRQRQRRKMVALNK
ncbi:MAG: hypothetical protein LW859_14775, partial [Anabaena sp. 49633_E8]|nr:hypothetical protein [Anabaena sp. 49633_E8]